VAGPPLVHRRAVPPRAEIQTLRAPSLVCGFRAGGEGGGKAGVDGAMPVS